MNDEWENILFLVLGYLLGVTFRWRYQWLFNKLFKNKDK